MHILVNSVLTHNPPSLSGYDLMQKIQSNFYSSIFVTGRDVGDVLVLMTKRFCVNGLTSDFFLFSNIYTCGSMDLSAVLNGYREVCLPILATRT